MLGGLLLTLIVGFDIAPSATVAIAQEQDFSEKQIDVQVGNKTYSLYYHMSSGGTINSISTDTYLTMVLNVTSPADGKLELRFPRELYDALSFTEHGDPILFVNEAPVDDLLGTTNSCEESSLVVPVEAGTGEYRIIYSDILTNHTHGYPQNIDMIRTIEVEEQNFSVRLATDSLKCEVSFLQQEKKLHVDIQGRSEAGIEQGYFRFAIPHDLLEGNYTVLVDGQPVEFEEQRFFIKDNTDIGVESAVRNDFTPYRASLLTFNYPVYAKSIDVVGTSAFPELGMADLNPKRNLKQDPVILSYDIHKGDEEARTIINFLITDEKSGESVKNVDFELEMTKIGGETPLLIDEFYAENGTITFDVTHKGPVQVLGVRNDFPYAWKPGPGTYAIPMDLPLEPDTSYQLKINILTTDYAHDQHPYPDEAVYLYFTTDSSEVGAIRIVPEFPYHVLIIITAVIGGVVALGRTGLLSSFYGIRK